MPLSLTANLSTTLFMLFDIPCCSYTCIPAAAHFRLQPVSRGGRKLQFGGISLASATTNGEASSVNSLKGQMSITPTPPTLGVTGNGLATGNSFGNSNTYSPGLGNSQATGAANAFGNSTSTQLRGKSQVAAAVITPALCLCTICLCILGVSTFGNGFGDFSAS